MKKSFQVKDRKKNTFKYKKKVISILNLEHWASSAGVWQTMHEAKSIRSDEAFKSDAFEINQKRMLPLRVFLMHGFSLRLIIYPFLMGGIKTVLTWLQGLPNKKRAEWKLNTFHLLIFFEAKNSLS